MRISEPLSKGGRSAEKKERDAAFSSTKRTVSATKKTLVRGGGEEAKPLSTHIHPPNAEGGRGDRFYFPPAQTNRMAKARRPTLPPPPLVHT